MGEFSGFVCQLNLHKSSDLFVYLSWFAFFQSYVRYQDGIGGGHIDVYQFDDYVIDRLSGHFWCHVGIYVYRSKA